LILKNREACNIFYHEATVRASSKGPLPVRRLNHRYVLTQGLSFHCGL